MSEYTILVVEDNDFVRMQIVSYLKAAPFSTLEASGGEAARDIIMHGEAGGPSVALAIVDVRMEPMGGFEFIRAIRSENVMTPIILVTGDQTPDILDQASRLGVAAVLMKPVEKDRLIGTVNRVLEGRRRA